jgi:hypothetical protein
VLLAAGVARRTSSQQVVVTWFVAATLRRSKLTCALVAQRPRADEDELTTTESRAGRGSWLQGRAVNLFIS